jgi:hypothetical protein
MIGGVAATAAVRTFPFRVFSFPKEIVRAPGLFELYPEIDPAFFLTPGQRLLLFSTPASPDPSWVREVFIRGGTVQISRRRFPIDTWASGVQAYDPDGGI